MHITTNDNIITIYYYETLHNRVSSDPLVFADVKLLVKNRFIVTYTLHITTAVSKAHAVGITVAIAMIDSTCLSYRFELPFAETSIKFCLSTGLSYHSKRGCTIIDNESCMIKQAINLRQLEILLHD